ncbi:MAG: dienelactone hydrolase family protein [Pseudomonadota bacterium]
MTEPQSAWISVDVPGGTMEAYLVRPSGGWGPGIVMLQEIFGVNEAMRAKAGDFAAAGYVVLVPDVFWRLEPRVDLAYTEADRTKAFSLMQALDWPKAIGDIAAAYEALKGIDGVDTAPSFVGYCLGGKLAVLAGAKVGDASAVVSFYGVRLEENIEQIKTLSCPVSIHVGDDDAHVPMDVVDTLKAALDGEDGVEISVYPGAQHGFFNRLRTDVYDAEASKKAWAKAMEVLPTPA